MSLKKIWPKILLVVMLFYFLALYELVITPAILEWSSLGVLLSTAVIGLLVFSLPAGRKIHYLALGTAFLMVNQALGNLQQTSVWSAAAGYAAVFIVIYTVIRLLAQISLGSFTIVFLMAMLINLIFYPAEYPLWSEFSVQWRSPVLYPKGVVDYFPLQVSDVNGKAGKEIIVQGNLERVKRSQQNQAAFDQGLPLAVDEETIYYVFSWDGKSFIRLVQNRYSVPKVAEALQQDFPSFPYYGVGIKTSPAGVKQVLTPLFTPDHLIREAMEFGNAPFNALVQDLESIGYFEKAWISFVQSVEIDGEIKRKQIPVLGTEDIVTGDVDADGSEDLMINSEYAEILTFGPQGEKKVLWVSPDDSFRFESFAPVGETNSPYIIARSKSQIRQNKARYITGYGYTPAGLEQKWRIFADLTDITAGDIDGDGKNELVGYLPNEHIVFVLEKHGLPVVETIYVISACLILFGFCRKYMQRRARHGEVN